MGVGRLLLVITLANMILIWLSHLKPEYLREVALVPGA
jgi:hypothetical protein